ncbi:uncharacterized protein LOC109807336 [Cajanus cajan]|uniref:uncharacterized protein LOC109807336 n=1 Tax=Cajanus cajan TaxID=3821 RepID=UPI00098D97B3|nr:uncharacterized protein LOC109807336 [Cajanus cajan]
MGRFISNAKTKPLTLLIHRHRSSQPIKSNWVEIDGLKFFEEHAHGVMVKKSTPDWLPFRPGSSFWVPPPSSSFPNKFSIFLQSQSPPASEVTLQLKVLTPSQNVTLSEDDEG